MRQGIGSVFLYNMIILFIAVVFAFLAGTMSYSKAFRVNSRVLNAIEKFEGYNELSKNEIKGVLSTFGYNQTIDVECKDKMDAENLNENGNYCVYRYKIDERHYSFGVQTYLTIDIPGIGRWIRLPIYTKSERIFKFTENP